MWLDPLVAIGGRVVWLGAFVQAVGRDADRFGEISQRLGAGEPVAPSSNAAYR